MGGRVNEATDLATLKSAIANVSFRHQNTCLVPKMLTIAEKKNFDKNLNSE